MMLKPLRMMLAVTALAVLATGCATRGPAVDYTAYRESHPASILVLPPVNRSPDITASYSVLSLVTMPLAESGYYVVPVAVADETFKQNGLTTADEIQAVPVDKLRSIFGADAGLYITVSQYGASYRVVDSVVNVEANAKLVDLRTGTVLWTGHAFASSTENQNSSGGGLIGLLVTAVVNQLINNLSDKSHAIAGMTSWRLLSAGQPGGLLYGPRSPKYGKTATN